MQKQYVLVFCFEVKVGSLYSISTLVSSLNEIFVQSRLIFAFELISSSAIFPYPITTKLIISAHKTIIIVKKTLPHLLTCENWMFSHLILEGSSVVGLISNHLPLKLKITKNEFTINDYNRFFHSNSEIFEILHLYPSINF